MIAEKRDIVFINCGIPYQLLPETLRLASSSHTASVKQLLILDTDKSLFIRDLIVDDENDDDDDDNNKETGQKGVTIPCSLESFQNVFSQAHTIILPESMLMHNSKLFHTQQFLECGGLVALQQFFAQQGGTVIFFCVEGCSFPPAKKINETFGTDWNFEIMNEDTIIEPTDIGRRYFGPYTPSQILLQNSPFFVRSTTGNQDFGLYQTKLCTRAQFEADFHAQDDVFDWHGVEVDETMTCFNVDKSWQAYLEQHTNCYPIAVHSSNTQTIKSNDNKNKKQKGHVVWFGDRTQNDTSLSFCFCKLMNLATDGNLEDAIDRSERETLNTEGDETITSNDDETEQNENTLTWTCGVVDKINAIVFNI